MSFPTLESLQTNQSSQFEQICAEKSECTPQRITCAQRGCLDSKKIEQFE